MVYMIYYKRRLFKSILLSYIDKVFKLISIKNNTYMYNMCFHNIYRCIVESIYGKRQQSCLIILEPDEDNQIVYYEYNN
jgi:hypothetical protein